MWSLDSGVPFRQWFFCFLFLPWMLLLDIEFTQVELFLLFFLDAKMGGVGLSLVH